MFEFNRLSRIADALTDGTVLTTEGVTGFVVNTSQGLAKTTSGLSHIAGAFDSKMDLIELEAELETVEPRAQLLLKIEEARARCASALAEPVEA